jgi:hypothetical protein
VCVCVFALSIFSSKNNTRLRKNEILVVFLLFILISKQHIYNQFYFLLTRNKTDYFLDRNKNKIKIFYSVIVVDCKKKKKKKKKKNANFLSIFNSQIIKSKKFKLRYKEFVRSFVRLVQVWVSTVMAKRMNELERNLFIIIIIVWS